METSILQSLNHLLETFYLPLRDRVQNRQISETFVFEHSHPKNDLQLNERFLQILWNEQCFNSPLFTVEEGQLEVVNPGSWNLEAGPDFKDAVLRINGEQLVGDVEIHQFPQDWMKHGHHEDERYEGVILHVVWQAAPVSAGDSSTITIPMFVMSEYLQRPWRTLIHEVRAEVYSYAQQIHPGACAVSMALADDDRVAQLLQVAGLARFQAKTAQMQRQIIAKGAGQAFYESFFQALGYKANKENFRSLAAAVPLVELTRTENRSLMEGVLFGRAGLLPDPSREAVAEPLKDWVYSLWDLWWQSGEEVLDIKWVRTGIRPLNTPERRLAAGIAVLRKTQLQPDLVLQQILEAATDAHDLLLRAAALFEVKNCWESFSTFSSVLRRPASLLGKNRADDILTNVVLPFLHALAIQRHDHAAGCLVQEAFLEMPKLQHNRLLEEAIHRYFVPPSRGRVMLRKAVCQQGLIELYQSFCQVLHMNCKNCPFVEHFLVEESQGSNKVSSCEKVAKGADAQPRT